MKAMITNHELYGDAVQTLQEIATNVARKSFPDLYADGYLDQELETIFEDCERIVAKIICEDDGSIREDAEDMWLLSYIDASNEVIDSVISSANIVMDFLKEFE